MLSSCKKEKKELVEVNQVPNEFKLEFLNEILSDTSENNYFKSKIGLISNYPLMIPEMTLGDPEFPNKHFLSTVEVLSHYLKTDDTIYLDNQLLKTNSLDLNNLSKYGYKIFDFKKCIDSNLSYDSIYKLTAIENLKHNFDATIPFLLIDEPIFNQKMNLAYIRFQQGSGGESVLFEKKNGKWMYKETITTWFE